MSPQCSHRPKSVNVPRQTRADRAIGRLVLIAVLIVLPACALLPQPRIHEPVRETPEAASTTAGEGAITYRPDRASLILHTYRAGWLKRLAHNHVMTTERIDGTLFITTPPSASSAILYFRPWDLVLDDPAERRSAGEGFESNRTPADIAATRSRMLGPDGFHSNAFPFVTVDVRWHDEAHAAVTIDIRDRLIEAVIPVEWSLDGGRLTVHADFELTHGQLGIRPYSAFAGAIAVADPIRVQLELTASPITSPDPKEQPTNGPI